ncbi:hypothetical protein FLBR109950_03510 [Flavobacterium branchiophilum]|uniref:hypothetical protein n=1 Tax=Flavobacterium branchiophilum TaxID=55197 RepID=UPI0002E7168B|nr:hypothetical protein [Flavobacterium branchiophilum]
MSSIASSAWQGGSTFETLGDVTTETIHKGISGATGLSNGFGTIAFGTLSGSAGAALTGGNFYLIDNCFQRYSMNLRFGKVL